MRDPAQAGIEVMVDESTLPADAGRRGSVLRDYFNEFSVESERHERGWKLRLLPPSRLEHYVDPRIGEGLRWWSDTFGPIELLDVPFAHHRVPRSMISLNDSWTLLSWSHWLASHSLSSGLPQNVTILHLDDHDDFMCPRVFLGHDGGLCDGVTGRPVDLAMPTSVESAIRSGAIGIGSFISPLLHHLPCVDVRHLCATQYRLDRAGAHWIGRAILEDSLLQLGGSRPALTVARGSRPKGAVAHPYLVTDDLKSWLGGLRDGPILLHVDMDYFCNPYNGDSDWAESGPKHERSPGDVIRRIDEVFDALGPIASRIEDCAIALSPGFFPVSLWSIAMSRVFVRLDDTLGRVRALVAPG